jgi:hypothetical protein
MKNENCAAKNFFSSAASFIAPSRQRIFYKQSEIIKIPKGFVLRIQQWQNGKSLVVLVSHIRTDQNAA